MMKRLLTLFAVFALSISQLSTISLAQPNYGKLPPLHVDGNQLRDEAGNKVVLHGIMDTPSPYFNSYRWGSSASSANISACVNYFNRLFTAETDSTQGAYCNLFRLHLDPCWTNDNSLKYSGFTVDSEGNHIDPLGNKVSGEADVYHYSGVKLTTYLKTVYWRITQQSLKHGMYVIMRPPGVCPGTIRVGTYYQDYLLDVWDRVSKNDSIKKYYGHVGLELANEPVRIENASGSTSDDKRMHDFFQPIVDKIRENGFKGIIWIPGGTWQQDYAPYGKYPITDPLNNIGYAIHDYPGWYSLSDNSYDYEKCISSVASSVPVVRTNPIVITEIDWSPEKEGTGHYNESGAWVVSNYGTWATATTSKWGNAFKKMKDYYGNISMTLSGSHCYFDWDTYKNSNYQTVVPAFSEAMKANGLDPMEACGTACFDWYKGYAQENYPSFERYQEVAFPENPFELSAEWFNPHILFEGTATHSSVMSTLKLKQGGCSGWRFDTPEGVDLSGYDTLKITLVKNATKNTFFRIYDNSCNANYAGDYYKLDMASAKLFEIPLDSMISINGNRIDPAHIRIAGFNSASADQTLYVKSVELIAKDPTAVTTAKATQRKPVEYYSVSGTRISRMQKRINIVKYSDGTIKKVYR